MPIELNKKKCSNRLVNGLHKVYMKLFSNGSGVGHMFH